MAWVGEGVVLYCDLFSWVKIIFCNGSELDSACANPDDGTCWCCLDSSLI